MDFRERSYGTHTTSVTTLLIVICTINLTSLVLEGRHIGVWHAWRVAFSGYCDRGTRLMRRMSRRECDGHAIQSQSNRHGVNLQQPKVKHGGRLISLFPVVLFLLWTALIPPVGLQLVHLATIERNATSEGLNPDIAGSGIRAGLYVPAVLSFLSIMLGCFHNHDGVVKEIGIAHLTNLASLFINTMKATSSITGLSSEERLIAIVSIDIASTGLRSTFSDKTALASRYFIRIATMMRLCGIISMCILLNTASAASATPSPMLPWYGSLEPNHTAHWLLWCLVGARCVAWLHDLLLVANRYTHEFDQGKKTSELRGRAHSAPFETLASSASSKHLECWPILALDIWTIEAVAHNLPYGELSDWGQSATLVVALAAALYWIYVVLKRLVWDQRQDWRKAFTWSLLRTIDRPVRDIHFWRTERRQGPQAGQATEAQAAVSPVMRHRTSWCQNWGEQLQHDRTSKPSFPLSQVHHYRP